MENYVKGRCIIVTGGSSGFGLATARLLLECGARVAITGRDAARLDAAVRKLGGGDALLAVTADATQTADWRRLVAAVLERFGALDVLVNNHGGGIKIAPTEEMDDAAIAAVLDLNLASVIRGCREVLPVMRAAGHGHILNVSSACARHSWPGWGVYTAAKAGLVGYTRCLALEMAPWGGKATCFIPGAARTNFSQAAHLDDSWQAGLPDAHDFARTLVHCLDVPPNSVIEEVSIWGTEQIKMLNPF
ncbi:MAG: SDR family NAD(P)-dependent oxidoreductase [Lentisphaeria bacterium]